MKFDTKLGGEVQFGTDGQVWAWTDAGQLVICGSLDAEKWVLQNVVDHQVDEALRQCKTWTQDLRAAWEERRTTCER